MSKPLEKEPFDILCEKIIERIYPSLSEQIIKKIESDVLHGKMGMLIKDIHKFPKET